MHSLVIFVFYPLVSLCSLHTGVMGQWYFNESTVYTADLITIAHRPVNAPIYLGWHYSLQKWRLVCDCPCAGDVMPFPHVIILMIG